MREHWSYNGKYSDSKGHEWHFATCDFMDVETDYSELPIEIYFRNDERTYFGMLRFEKRKDNPYQFEKLIEKVMNKEDFREQCHAPDTQQAWSRNWK